MSVEGDGDSSAITADLLKVPLPNREKMPAYRGDHSVDAAMQLIWLQGGILLGAIIDDLRFHSLECGVSFGWGSKTETIVGPRRQLEFKPQNKVGIFLCSVDVTAIARFAANLSVYELISIGLADPAR